MKTLLIKTEDSFLKSKYDIKKNHNDDSGVDLYCPRDLVIPGKSLSNPIELDIMCEMVDSDVNVPYCLVPRSSMGSKTTLRLSNSFGVIDSGYRGMIKGYVDNLGNDDYHIKQGDRLFQIISSTMDPIECKLVEALSETNRGRGGFGSTGK